MATQRLTTAITTTIIANSQIFFQLATPPVHWNSCEVYKLLHQQQCIHLTRDNSPEKQSKRILSKSVETVQDIFPTIPECLPKKKILWNFENQYHLQFSRISNKNKIPHHHEHFQLIFKIKWYGVNSKRVTSAAASTGRKIKNNSEQLLQ